ncbi:MAG: hypothetical protein JW783_09025 [Bacteroidales bacterium]|nr:hypothetical protein [Bacteroidales bacterium]MBN2748089.1 hypothetical protein [Bacteroidales bacterium]
MVTPANEHDSTAAERVIKRMKGQFPQLKLLLGDGGYKAARQIRSGNPQRRDWF